ncbi:cell division protein FtsI (penicillin-binding protein 3) [Streptomyces griseus]
MPSKEPPRRRVPGPARSRNAAGGPGRARPAARAEDRRPRRPAAPAKRRGASPQAIRLGSPRPRLRLISLCLTLVMLAFVVRLLQVQAVDANAYTAKAEKNRYLEYTIAAERGEITDRSGISLATSVDAHDITADPKLFTPEDSKAPDAPQQAAALLAPILGKDEAELAKKLSTPKSRYTVLARRQTPQVWKQIKDLKSVFAEKAAEDRAKGGPGANVLAGVLQEPTTRRVYPNGNLAAGILGFVNAEGKGGGGLEAQLNKKLQGEDGKIRYAQAGGRPVPTAGSTEIPAVAGTDVELTIDRDIQWAAQRAIADQVEKSRADRGYVIVQNTRTGEVLAMANAPGYDPNDLAQSNSAALGNAALQDVYEPGSTSKVMSIAAVLEEGAATPDTHVTVPNRLHRGDRLFRDDVDHPTWYLTLNGVLAKSSNIGTILATGQLGKTQPEANKVLYSYLRKFGLGSTTGLDYPGESPGIVAKPQDWSTSQQYTIPFGQGLSPQRHAGRLGVPDHRQRRGPDRAHPRTRDQGRGRPLHRVGRPEADPGGQREDGRNPGEDAGVRRGRQGGHRHQGPHPGLPGRRQDGHGQPGRPGARRLQGLHRVVRRLRARRRPPGHRVLRDPEPHRGKLLRRSDLRPDLQEGHGVRPQDPPDTPVRQGPRPAAGVLQARRVTRGNPQ